MRIQNPRGLRILHISDTHLTGDGSFHYGIVDTRANLERVLERAAVLDSIDLVAVSGDLSDDGSEVSYREIQRLIEPWASKRDAIVAYAMGNHDNRDNFEAVLGPRIGVMTLRGFRIIWLDSSVPSKGYGEIDESQLCWLRTVLEQPVEDGSVVIVHHPPIAANSALLAALELRNPRPLIEACEGSDVRAILSGHYHSATASFAGRTPVFVASGIANYSDPIALEGTERATISSGFSLVDLSPDGAARASFITVPGSRDGEQIFSLSRADVADIVKGFGPS